MERLQKYMARCGVASRRKAEEMITAGEVRVNGEIVKELGFKIEPERDKVEVKGIRVVPPEHLVYLLLHKPKGYVTTARDPEGRPTVLDLVHSHPAHKNIRVYPVGRLDRDTTGLLLLTNDGNLAYALTHPSHQVEKVYEAMVAGIPDNDKLNRLRRGILLEDGLTSPAEVDILSIKEGNAILRVAIHEGRKRQVRRMCRAVGHPVLELKRIAMGPLFLGDLPPGQVRPLAPEELRKLRKILRKVCGKEEPGAQNKKR